MLVTGRASRREGRALELGTTFNQSLACFLREHGICLGFGDMVLSCPVAILEQIL